MGQERIVRKTIEARGRPRKTWLDNIKEYGANKGLTMPEMEKMAGDRKVWRRFSEEARR